MADIRRLPGEGCRHHETGHCLYEEHLNPGYEAWYRCRVLLHWESAFDDFLARVENFGVKQEVISDLWRRKFERLARETFRCDNYVYEATAGVPACAHAVDGLCRLELPDCEGRCRHYDIEMIEEQA